MKESAKSILEEALRKIKDEYGVVITDLSAEWINTGALDRLDYRLHQIEI